MMKRSFKAFGILLVLLFVFQLFSCEFTFDVDFEQVSGITENVSEETEAAFVKSLSKGGLVQKIDEGKIDAASALHGCGPAFVYLFIEALADGAVACGLPRDTALSFAAKTVKGAAEMVLETGKHPGALKDAVTSPGGTTIEGVRVLEEQGFRGAAMDAVIAAYEKTLALGK
jgi:pyrroline-5-carboxylate reductase